MTDSVNPANVAKASWRELLTRQYLPKLAIMALALWLHASNSMLTATTMPSAVDEIGGLNLISWTFALYLAGSITAAASISLLVARYGLKSTMIRTALVFTLGAAKKKKSSARQKRRSQRWAPVTTRGRCGG